MSLEHTEQQQEPKYRVGIKETAKKEQYWEFTVRGDSIEEVLKDSDVLRLELEARYPKSEE
tara:strand:- start:669 stop:851 length:183 start_codon:yes stop_codon:yes gene_type:complete